MLPPVPSRPHARPSRPADTARASLFSRLFGWLSAPPPAAKSPPTPRRHEGARRSTQLGPTFARARARARAPSHEPEHCRERGTRAQPWCADGGGLLMRRWLVAVAETHGEGGNRPFGAQA